MFENRDEIREEGVNKERENRSLWGSQVREILYLFNVFDWMRKVRKKGGKKGKKYIGKQLGNPYCKRLLIIEFSKSFYKN